MSLLSRYPREERSKGINSHGIDIFLLEISSLSTWRIHFEVFDFPCARKCVLRTVATPLIYLTRMDSATFLIVIFTNYCFPNSRILSHMQNISRYIQMARAFNILLWSDTGRFSPTFFRVMSLVQGQFNDCTGASEAALNTLNTLRPQIHQ